MTLYQDEFPSIGDKKTVSITPAEEIVEEYLVKH